MIFDLIVQIFMAVSVIGGVTMVIFTIGYRHVLRTNERICRYIIGGLLLYSVAVRLLVLLPGEVPFFKARSIVFDLFYIAVTIFFNINIFMRRATHDENKRRKYDQQ